MTRWLMIASLASMLGAAFASCGGGDDEGCPGIICNNCATDCDVQCASGETEACVGLEYFGGDNPDDLRCAYCE